ncbi:MAG: type II toxin-antitoxin system RelE/ParE family toxin [Lachnospiraceae bacterium]|nr:type II toxin-antitoxin system RelE/ParE family toxin [Lachnospiraceae bacterium]
MAYKLIVSEYADELLDSIIDYLLFHLKSDQAAAHLLDGIENIYSRMEENPYQFPPCNDTYLAKKGYREAIVPQMNYIVIFSISTYTVKITGIFHQLEAYEKKL